MSKRLLLVTSFGTTHENTCEKNIATVEAYLAQAFPDFEVRRAFTSGMIIRALAKRGIVVDDVPAALKRAQVDGFDEVIVLATHLLYGEEYEKIHRQVAECGVTFARPVVIAKPLIADTEDIQTIVRMLSESFPTADKTALVLMGHGSTHYVNPIYAALQTAFRLAGRRDVYVGTVEAWPGIDEVVEQLKEYAYEKVVLTPLMLVAGDHAVNDMAGDEDESWKTILQNEGYTAEIILRGLGEYEPIRALYEAHVTDALAHLGHPFSKTRG